MPVGAWERAGAAGSVRSAARIAACRTARNTRPRPPIEVKASPITRLPVSRAANNEYSKSPRDGAPRRTSAVAHEPRLNRLTHYRPQKFSQGQRNDFRRRPEVGELHVLVGSVCIGFE